jgi:hypothetical protein
MNYGLAGRVSTPFDVDHYPNAIVTMPNHTTADTYDRVRCARLPKASDGGANFRVGKLIDEMFAVCGGNFDQPIRLNIFA